MAFSATDWLALAVVKAELRIGAEVTDADGLLLGHMGAAVHIFAREADVNIVGTEADMTIIPSEHPDYKAIMILIVRWLFEGGVVPYDKTDWYVACKNVNVNALPSLV